MPNNIAIIGDSDFISGFKALGYVLYAVDDKTDIRAVFTEVLKSDFLCIFILESLALKIMDLIGQYTQVARPLIVPLPDFRQDLYVSEDLLSRLTIRAVGQDITPVEKEHR